MPVLWQGLDTMTSQPPFCGRECMGAFCTQLRPCKECREHLDATEVEEALARPTNEELLGLSQARLDALTAKAGVLTATQAKHFLKFLQENPDVLVPELDHGIEGSKTTLSGDPK